MSAKSGDDNADGSLPVGNILYRQPGKHDGGCDSDTLKSHAKLLGTALCLGHGKEDRLVTERVITKK